MLHRGRGCQGISGLCQGPAAPFSTGTYPVLARVALTLTHTATKMAGRPVGAEGQRVRDWRRRPRCLSPPHTLPGPFLSSLMTPS